MTIRRQLTLLSFFIIVIPITCAIFIRIQSYIVNHRQYLIDGTKNFNSSKISYEDINKIHQKLQLLPSDVECLLIQNNNTEILYSTFQDFMNGGIISKSYLIDYMKDTSNLFFYQFTVTKVSDKECLLITRIPHQKHYPQRKLNMIRIVMTLLIILVSICFIMVIIISKTIFTSIIKIENKTQQLAAGNLSNNIILDSDNTQKNEITSIMEGLEKMRLSLIEVINRKNKFIMGISHDLRTPVAIIKGYTEAISDGVITTPEEISKSLELIEGRTTQLSEMIDSLISYMKLNDSEIRQKLIPEPICTIIKDFAKSSTLAGNVFKRKIISNLNLPEKIYVPLDEQLVIRSFENIFNNALRYTKDNDTIEINSYVDTTNIILEIKDSGIGIKEEDLNHIFDLFYRGTNSRREEGMGIGLSVVKNIMDTHGWIITVDSEFNKGTCFTIKIPIK